MTQTNTTPIQVRSLFGEWKTVTREQAKSLVLFVFQHNWNLRKATRNQYMNSQRLRGVTVEELLDE